MRSRGTAIGMLTLVALGACSGYGGMGAYGGGGSGGGVVGSVTVGPGIQFVSGHNGNTNAAVDTIPVGGTVTWSWTGTLPHSVQAVGSPSFGSSSTMTGSGMHAVTFTAPGTYQYDCAVHGTAMTGTIVVR